MNCLSKVEKLFLKWIEVLKIFIPIHQVRCHGLVDILVVVGARYQVWSSHKEGNTERIHLTFCRKHSIGYEKSICKVMIYAELGRFSLRYLRIYNITISYF